MWFNLSVLIWSNIILQWCNRFIIRLTIKEKRQLALNGEDVPICVAGDKKVKKYNVPIHKYIPNKNEDKRLNLK